MDLPKIVQGGMGVAVSDWRLAQAVARLGQLGVVSGTGLSRVLVSRLMDGDPEGHVRRALSYFPSQEVARQIVERYFIAGGKPPDTPYKTPPAYTSHPPKSLDLLTVAANFVEVYLAKENHDGLVGINLLEKLQLPNLASLYGAMLAGVDYVLMGAGIPTQVASVLDKLATHQAVSYRIDVVGAEPDDNYRIYFDPEDVFPGISQTKLKRPKFLPIISSVVLAQALLKRSEGEIDGFIVEGHLAGGHNAPPRGAMRLNERGEPVYGEKDIVDLERLRQLGKPFWLAGGYGRPEKLKEALEAGAAGVQVGTVFALCAESGLRPDLKQRLLAKIREGRAEVLTSAVASPTGFPFKVVRMEGTMSEQAVYAARPRTCDLGFLRTVYKKEDGTLGYRCPAEPVDDYVRKGGKATETVCRTCLCNNLMATAGFAQLRRDGYVEQPILTSSGDLESVCQFTEYENYTAAHVVEHILRG